MRTTTQDQHRRTSNNSDFWKQLIATLAAFALAPKLASFIPGPVAAFIGVISLGVIFYWIPPKPKMNYAKWLLHLTKYALFAGISLAVFMLLGHLVRSIAK